jgi:transcriptional regulator with XRE-family HTH domain
MNGQPLNATVDLAYKIARLVDERGWNQEDFSRIAQLNRQTVHQIMNGGQRKLRNATISACATALGVPVSDLKSLPLERLLARMHDRAPPNSDESLKRLYEQATQPELRAWIERNPERAGGLDEDELDELLSLQGVGGPLTSIGVEHFIAQLERRRQLVHKVKTIAGTELVELLEKLIELMYDKIQPYADRK